MPSENNIMATKKRRRDTPAIFSKILTSLMEEHKIGVREAARAAGVGPSTIVSWRSGAQPEDYTAVKKLAERLGTSLTFLLTGEDESRKHFPSSFSEIFVDEGVLFDGYAKVTITKLILRKEK